MKQLAILLSGRGSNFEAIADNINGGRLDASIAVVISNRPDARGLQIARERGLNAVTIPSKGLDREAYDRRLIEELRKQPVDLVCLAGYMRLLSRFSRLGRTASGTRLRRESKRLYRPLRG